MSTLTKILVVILVLLAIAHSAILLAYLSQQQPWKELALGHAEQIEKLRAEFQSNNLANTQIQEQLRREKQALKDQLAATDILLIQANTDLTNLQFKLGKLTTANDTFRQRLANFDDSLKRAQKARDYAQTHLGRAQDTASKLKAENTELENSVSELTRDLKIRNTELRRQKEQIASLQDQIRKASDRTTAQIPTTVAVQPVPVMARRSINGKIIDVTPDNKIAVVNVGSIAGVAEGTKFTIFDHEYEYVGDLLITRVFRDRSLGTIVMSAKPVRLGNQVSTDPLR